MCYLAKGGGGGAGGTRSQATESPAVGGGGEKPVESHFEASDELLLGRAGSLLFVWWVRERMKYERKKGRKKSRRGDG